MKFLSNRMLYLATLCIIFMSKVNNEELSGKTYLQVPGYDKKVPFGVMTYFAYPLENGGEFFLFFHFSIFLTIYIFCLLCLKFSASKHIRIKNWHLLKNDCNKELMRQYYSGGHYHHIM